ncbi:hypothetical protein Mpt1_c08630 [Candidatus Methanoplasma termitum]|uniref:Uncharacterized protein n=1 Tax=Candidatus Methanoplasma termitum TaxID=1577791 RepID=A0A0A7LCE6_9ARCH|nr:hypothetical protein [Candidatus Methanoplasma termitum]AIZ56739.1 hypothetical protein Mpt1_c08630 [Candidatus Methanoplasma termitum]
MVTLVNYFECEKCKAVSYSEADIAKHEKNCHKCELKDWQGKIIKRPSSVEVVGEPYTGNGVDGYRSIIVENSDEKVSVSFLDWGDSFDPRYCGSGKLEEISIDELKVFYEEAKVSFANAIERVITSLSPMEEKQ